MCSLGSYENCFIEESVNCSVDAISDVYQDFLENFWYDLNIKPYSRSFQNVLAKYKFRAARNKYSNKSLFEKRDSILWDLLKEVQKLDLPKDFPIKFLDDSYLHYIKKIKLQSPYYSQKELYSVITNENTHIDEIINFVNSLLKKIDSHDYSSVSLNNLRSLFKNLRKQLEEIILMNHGLIYKNVKPYFLWGNDIDSLIQECYIGMYKSACRYLTNSNAKFSTYASWWQLASISRFIRLNSLLVRIPVHKIEEMISSKSDTKSWREYLVDNNYSPQKVLYSSFLSCNLFESSEGIPLLLLQQDLEESEVNDIEYYQFADFNEEYEQNSSFKVIISRIFECLKEKEKEVISYRFGLFGVEQKTLEEIGILFGVTRERIRQIELKALEKLKEASKKLNIAKDIFYED